MKINKAYESPLGTVKFEGEISDDELAFVLEAGLMTTVYRGMFVKKALATSDAVADSKEQTIQ